MSWRARGVGIVAALLVSGAAFAGGMYTGHYRAQATSEWVEGRLISTAIDSVRANALDTLPSDELIKRAVAGMLRELHDPYAALLRPDGFERYRGSLQGDGRGLGVIMRRQADEVRVARVVRGSPAWVHGVRAGDRVMAVNGVAAVSAWSPRDTTAARTDTTEFLLQRGPAGDTVRIDVVRREWHMPAVENTGLVAERVGYVHLSSVSSRAAEELEQSVETLLERGAESLVLDLRGNGGGLFDEGVRVASLFLPRGAVVASVAGRDERDLKVHEVKRTRWPELPLTVLVDAHTASAAELVAAALRDHDRAQLIGSRTYGKGLVQRVVRLSPELALRLTTARWLPPSGEVIQRREGRGVGEKGGMVPDVQVENAAVHDPFTLPASWSAARVSDASRAADSVATQALREAWVVTPTAMLEARIRVRARKLVPRRGLSEAERSEWIDVVTRLATGRVLEVRADAETMLRFRATGDAALRVALDSLAPPAAPMHVLKTGARRASSR